MAGAAGSERIGGVSEAPKRLELVEDPMGGWWSALDTPPEGREAYVHDETVAKPMAEVLRGLLARSFGVHAGMGGEDIGHARAALAAYEEATKEPPT